MLKSGKCLALDTQNHRTPATTGTHHRPTQSSINDAGIRYNSRVEGSETRVAELEDGTYCSFVRDCETGQVAMKGIIPRWPHMPPVTGSWAISSDTGELSQCIQSG